MSYDIVSVDKEANIIRINLNLKENEELLNGDRLYSYVCEQYDSKKNYMTYILPVLMLFCFQVIWRHCLVEGYLK